MGIVDDHDEPARSGPARELGTGTPQDVEQITTRRCNRGAEQPRQRTKRHGRRRLGREYKLDGGAARP
jgi:hypothetical protein